MIFDLPPYSSALCRSLSSKSVFSTPHDSLEIFDILRRRWVRLTSEEDVRQRVLHYLLGLGYPGGRIAVESTIDVNGTRKRCDAIVFDEAGTPLVIVECKAPKVKITQRVFDQTAVYNNALHVPYLLLTNGSEHYFCAVDTEHRRYVPFERFPNYEELTKNQ